MQENTQRFRELFERIEIRFKDKEEDMYTYGVIRAEEAYMKYCEDKAYPYLRGTGSHPGECLAELFDLAGNLVRRLRCKCTSSKLKVYSVNPQTKSFRIIRSQEYKELRECLEIKFCNKELDSLYTCGIKYAEDVYLNKCFCGDPGPAELISQEGEIVRRLYCGPEYKGAKYGSSEGNRGVYSENPRTGERLVLNDFK